VALRHAMRATGTLYSHCRSCPLVDGDGNLQDNATTAETVVKDERGLRRTMTPAVVLNVTEELSVMKDEIFGPILPIVPYRKLEDAVAYINARRPSREHLKAG
jgi:acyl-CoA reductase-like NAD-dependent aldehyde dehydrogenase